MRSALGLEVNLVQVVDTGQHLSTAFQGDNKHIAGSQAAINGTGEESRDVAEGEQIVVGVDETALVVLLKVHGSGGRNLLLGVRVKHVVVGDWEEIPEELCHCCLYRVTVRTAKEREEDYVETTE